MLCLWFQVQTWTVVKERNCEDSSRGKICGDWVIVDRCEVLITYCACCELIYITQITLRCELLSQIRGSDVVLRDRIHKDSRIT